MVQEAVEQPTIPTQATLALAEDARVRFLVFVGLDGYRSIVTVEDALADGVLIADRLDGQQLTPEHGAPARLVSPDQYGFVSTKYLCRIELHPTEPVNLYHSRRSVQRDSSSACG